MIDVRQTEVFSQWLRGLRDRHGRRAITVRIQRLALGNAGDVKPGGHGVSELRISHGPGYRVYFVKREKVVILLLCGGDKSSQDADIAKAHVMAAELED
ncbi:MAG: type II toxin-antitoxin system RelE/ParE family toxin [Terracidiphilus sp.]